ncbi:hypothetical protein K377_06681 [Streptomyces sp. PsTaAH-137]|nr:hypothetical protein K377_06681 [Streptomyces sp. PsTaAH-137]
MQGALTEKEQRCGFFLPDPTVSAPGEYRFFSSLPSVRTMRVRSVTGAGE